MLGAEFLRVKLLDPGFAPEAVITMSVSPPFCKTEENVMVWPAVALVTFIVSDGFVWRTVPLTKWPAEQSKLYEDA